MSKIYRTIRVQVLLLILGNQAIETNVSRKGTHMLSEVVVRVDFKDLDLQLLDVFDSYIYIDLFINSECLLIVM